MSKPRNQGFDGAGCDERADEVRRRLDDGPRDHAADGEQQRDRHAVREADRARPERDDGRRREAEADHPRRHGRRRRRSRRAPTDAAITLFTPIQAKFVT